MGETVQLITHGELFERLVLMWSFTYALITPLWAWFLFPPKFAKR